MSRAAESIIDYCVMRLEGDRRLRNVRFFISGSEAPGEGEVKLMDWINSYVRSREEVRWSTLLSGEYCAYEGRRELKPGAGCGVDVDASRCY